MGLKETGLKSGVVFAEVICFSVELTIGLTVVLGVDLTVVTVDELSLFVVTVVGVVASVVDSIF